MSTSWRIGTLDVYFVEDRNAFCRLDENGDIVDVIKIVEERKEDWIENITVIAIRTRDFAEYMPL